MKITPTLLKCIGANPSIATRYAARLEALCNQYGIDTPLRKVHFLAQVFHESGALRVTEENVNYSAAGLRKVFGKYFQTNEIAKQYERKPQMIGNRAYADRMGNGNEASGDGYRYRGRGLIQLTGKNNYRAFNQWLQQASPGVDVVANPDFVSSAYAVECAVWYWTKRNINVHADSDDLDAVTRAVNGGLNGIDDRRKYLKKAKACAKVPPPAELDGGTHRVIATALNLRDKPIAQDGKILATLPQGTVLQKLGGGGAANWIRVRALAGNALVEGVVSSKAKYINAIGGGAPQAEDFMAVNVVMPDAHLEQNRSDIKRSRDGGRAYPLGESDRPGRTGSTPAEQAKSLIKIAKYLAPDKDSHQRYQRKGSTTYCNIYAHDFCYLAGVYLPRVWWTDKALIKLAAGEKLEERYGKTVRELRANDLLHWLEEHGPDFGWERETSLTQLQAAANNGEVGVIVADTGGNSPGHIAIVLPETAQISAGREDGEVVLPVMSQAGGTNYTMKKVPSAWWERSDYVASAFWSHP